MFSKNRCFLKKIFQPADIFFFYILLLIILPHCRIISYISSYLIFFLYSYSWMMRRLFKAVRQQVGQILHFVIIRGLLEDFRLVLAVEAKLYHQLKSSAGKELEPWTVTAGELHLHIISYFVWKNHCSGAIWPLFDLVFKPRISRGWSGPFPRVIAFPAFCLSLSATV